MGTVRFRVASVVAVGALAVAACGGQSPSSAPAASDNGSGDNGEAVTIEYWDFVDPAGDNPRAVQLAANIAAFEDQHPNINVNVQVVTFGELVQRLPQAAASGEGPDVVKMFNPQVPLMVDAGVYQPLDEYVEAGSADEFLLDTAVNVFDGETMVLPYEYRAVVLFYRPDLLGDREPPETWEDLISIAGEVGLEGVTGFQNGFSVEDNASILMEVFDTVMFQQDQEIFNDAGEAVFDTEGGLAFFDLFKQLQEVDALGPGVVQASYPDAQDGIISGTAAMATFGSHRITTVKAEAGDAAQWKEVPVFADGERATLVTGWTLGIGAHSEHPEEAAQFIEYMTSTEAQVRLAIGGEVPSRVSTFEDPLFSSPDGELINQLADYIAEYGRMRTYPESWTQLGTILAESMQAMILQDLSAQETMEMVATEFNSR